MIESPDRTAKPATGRRRRAAVRPRTLVSGLTFAVLVAATVSGTWLTHVVVGQQERRLLAERTREVRLVLTTAVNAIEPELNGLGTVLEAGGDSTADFTRAAATEVAAGGNTTTYAVLAPSATGYRVEAVAGRGLRVGETLSAPQGQAARDAARLGGMVASSIVGAGSSRSIGFALRPTAAPAGALLYEQLRLGPVSAPREAATAPFHEVRVVLYASGRADPSQVLVTSTEALPLRGSVDYLPMAIGRTHWLLGVDATQPLVGALAADAEWLVLGIGLIGSVLLTLVLRIEARRRDAAERLYESEHHLAESLQRSLLPVLPDLSGLDMAARYRAGGSTQQVGGDWFDAFPLEGGRVGVVIGDVMGHDIAAATAMSQIRAALRAFAWQGRSPATVLQQLDRLVDAFAWTDLVTVFYGVLDPPVADGSRTLRYANAGHLPPVLRLPGGQVISLAEGRSIVIGAPSGEARGEGEQIVAAGSMLLLYTDGLVEVPGTSLEDSLRRLGTTVRGNGSPEAADGLCERVLAAMLERPSHDDVAVLAIQVLSIECQPPVHPGAKRVSVPLRPDATRTANTMALRSKSA